MQQLAFASLAAAAYGLTLGGAIESHSSKFEASCENTAGSNVDDWGSGCSFYDEETNREFCYEAESKNESFDPTKMCCSCGGGISLNSEI